MDLPSESFLFSLVGNAEKHSGSYIFDHFELFLYHPEIFCEESISYSLVGNAEKHSVLLS